MVATVEEFEQFGDAGEVDWETAPMCELEDRLTLFAARIASATAAWLGWLAIFDRRAGFESWGCRSTAHWLNWKCATSYSTGYEHVRIARALEALPTTRAAFGEGRLSYSKVRAITRVATVDSEGELCELALASTAVQIESICAGYRQGKLGGPSSEQEQAAAAHMSRRMIRRDNYDGTSTITIVLPTADANACENAIDIETDSIIADAVSSETTPEVTARQVTAERHGIAAVRADAFVNLLTSPDDEPVAVKLEVLVDIEQLSGADDDDNDDDNYDDAGLADGSTCETGGTRIAPEVARRLGCDAQITSLSEDPAGRPLSVGRETRVVPRRIRRALNRRDQNRCQFLGCNTTRRLHAHHIVHWANGGPTELANLVLVCGFHHHLLHEHGWNAEANPSGGHTWITPTGETATIKVSRGRLSDLGGELSNPELIHKLSGDTLRDLSWITTALIHNETNKRARRAR